MKHILCWLTHHNRIIVRVDYFQYLETQKTIYTMRTYRCSRCNKILQDELCDYLKGKFTLEELQQ